MKSHTSGGDKGRTSLLSGERVAKCHPRIEACGDVDELSCALGALAAGLPESERLLRDEILAAQRDLFVIGARIATAAGAAPSGMLPGLNEESTRRLEAGIERLEQDLPVLQAFVLPGGHPTAASAHLARAVCRRAERRVTQLLMDPAEKSAAADLEQVIPFLNRLSNYLYAAARHCNMTTGVEELTWSA